MDWIKLRLGDKITCVNDKFRLITRIYCVDLTVGKTYEVLSISIMYMTVKIKNDVKQIRSYNFHYFKIPNETICKNIGIE